jgi:putative MFS transporter
MIASDDAVEPVQMALALIGIGRFQFRLLVVLGLVWAADAMQVLSIGLSAPGVATSFDIVIPIALQTGTAFFLGMMVGAPAFGTLADRFGRRRIFLLTVACDATFGMLAATAPTFQLLLLCRFLTGCAVGGTLPVDYAVMAEFMPSQARGRWLVGLEAFWAIGAVGVALIAWLLQFLAPANAWRWLLACASLPALVGFWFRISIPESALFLLKTGRADAAERILQQIAVMNGSPAVVKLREIRTGAAETHVGLLVPGLRRRTFLIAATWLFVSVSYYGIFTWLTARLATAGFGFVRGYGFLVLTALAQLPGYA